MNINEQRKMQHSIFEDFITICFQVVCIYPANYIYYQPFAHFLKAAEEQNCIGTSIRTRCHFAVKSPFQMKPK